MLFVILSETHIHRFTTQVFTRHMRFIFHGTILKIVEQKNHNKLDLD